MMNTDERRDDATSVLGHSEEERRRLIDQADFFAGFSERLFVDAGTGVRILDVGTGSGRLVAASTELPR